MTAALEICLTQLKWPKGVADDGTKKAGVTPGKPIWKNIGSRAVSAVIFALICIPPIYIGGYLWAVFVLLLGLRLVLEWVRMSDPNRDWTAMAIPMVGLTLAIGYVGQEQAAIAFAIVAVTAILAGLERLRRGGLMWSFLGTLYIAVPTVLMIALRGSDAGLSDGLKVMLFIILVVVGADVGAYLGGSAVKGPKIAPKLSPNKTWSGFVSGLVLGSVIGLIIGKTIGLDMTYSLLLSLPIIVFSVIGDFLESGLKRHFNVKDTGKLIPGHGGLLDRVDGLMLSIVASALVLWTVPTLWPGVL